MIRPWYRSRLFWLGLPGLVFMLWAWGDSTRHVSSLSWASNVWGFYARTWGNSLELDLYHSVYPGMRSNLDFYRWPLSRLSTPVEHPLFPAGVRFGTSHNASNGLTTRILVIALWLMITAYTAVWLGALACWQRRKARLSRRAAAELPGS